MIGITAVLFASAFAGISATEYSCLSRKPCVLNHVNLVSEAELTDVVFPDVTDPLTIASGKIPNLTRQLAEKLSAIVDLTINSLAMETIYIRPEMKHVEAVDNVLHTILVDDDKTKTYELLSLNLTNNRLTNAATLARFDKLRALNLDGNALELLSMDTFAQMTELRTLSVARNQLLTLETERGFNLMKLRSLSLAGNQLLELDVHLWELASLKEFDLTNNRLYMLTGNFGQFKSLEQVKISGNYWKCEILVQMNRIHGLKFDSEGTERCKQKVMTEVKQICCTLDASNFLTSPVDGEGLFGEKWEELRMLQANVTQLNELVLQVKEQSENETATKESALEQRIQQLEEQLEKLTEKCDPKEESVAVEETNELRSVVSDHKNAIRSLEEKLSAMSEELEGFSERLNDFRGVVDEKFEKVDGVPEKLENLETLLKESDSLELMMKNLTVLENSLRSLEGQQLKYHLSSVDLKSQINKERYRIDKVQDQYAKLASESEFLREQLNKAQENIGLAYKIIEEISEE